MCKNKCRIKSKIGEVGYNNKGEKMTITDYRSSIDIDVQFEDGSIKTGVRYGSFKRGAVSKKVNRVGEYNYNNKREKMTIVAYRSCLDIDVQFEDGTIRRHIQYSNFCSRAVDKIPARRKKSDR